MAIDKQRIVDNFYPTGSTVAEQFVPKISTPVSAPGDGALVSIRSRCRQADVYRSWFRFTRRSPVYRDVVRVYLPHVNQVAQDIQAQLAGIGVKVNSTRWNRSVHRPNSKGKQAFFLLGWGMDYPDATNFYDYHFASNALRFGTEFPDIVEEIKAAARPATRPYASSTTITSMR